MISTWMLYAGGLAALVGLSALASERIVLGLGRPVRWVWAGALALSLLLPLGSAWLSAGPGAAGGIVIDLASAEVIAAAPASDPGAAARLRMERVLAAAWLLGSAALLATLLLTIVRAERQQQRWRHGILAGRAVLVASDTGPAVVGFLWPEIVVPRWVLDWDESAQRLLLAHEREHLRAGDAHLLLAALAALVLMPWNLPLWWQVRRLRLAIEVDCDARVLRTEGRPREYGLLLLEVGRRASRPLVPPAAFSESRSLLEQRIRILAAPPRFGRRVRVGLAVQALAALAVACELPDPARPDLTGLFAPGAEAGPTPSREPPTPAGAPAPDPAPAALTRRPELLTPREEVARVLERSYPPMLRAAGIGGTAVLWVFVDQNGAVADTRVARSSGRPELDEAARSAMRAFRFSAAANGEAGAPAWIQLPVVFGRGEAGASGAPGAGAETVALPLWSGPRGAAPASSTPTPVEVRPELRNAGEVGRLLERLYPPLLREAGVRGTVVLWVHIDARGAVRETGVARSSGRAELDSAARSVMQRARFTAARIADRPVDAWIQLPVAFEPR